MAQNTHLRAIKSYYSSELGALVTLEDDVLSIVSQVRDLYGDKVSIQLDPDTGWYHFVAHEADGTDRLIFSVDCLDPRALDRLQRADSHTRGFRDPYEAAEREQDELQALMQRERSEQMLEAGEELVFHLKRQGLAPRMPAQIYVPRSLDA
jgi:hypothetical protein